MLLVRTIDRIHSDRADDAVLYALTAFFQPGILHHLLPDTCDGGVLRDNGVLLQVGNPYFQSQVHQVSEGVFQVHRCQASLASKAVGEGIEYFANHEERRKGKGGGGTGGGREEAEGREREKR